MRTTRGVAGALLLLLSACAGHSNTNTSAGHDSRLIRLDQIESASSQGVGNVYELISRIHPEWLRATLIGVTGRLAEPSVWLDGQRLGNLSTLRTVALGVVTQVRFMTPSEAQGHLGLDNLGGAIVMSSGR